MRDLSRIANPARSGTVLARLPESPLAFVATRAVVVGGGPPSSALADDVTGIRDALKRRRHGDARHPRFNVAPARWKYDGVGERLTAAEVRVVSRVRGVPCELTPMVFENIEMRNPAGFLLEDARHGYIQYISLSECYFAGKGAALVLPPNERARPSRRVSAAGCDIQQHLQSMFYLLRPEETLKMVSTGDVLKTSTFI
ncbi:PREDICTED: uncharacterized protein LOC105562449 isoform X1 [Vollenhovia emeryi]|uniref:uncharacterized protein LOC105562449 isoform X1 n=1 Tax=Vollenhovia emeryi TaxID=411798 RepID=UPI0005F532C1|nr:PREDICTED: uncharacterized protein LOC105562449 isoform X1 [Vollenhovia emeryi]